MGGVWCVGGGFESGGYWRAGCVEPGLRGAGRWDGGGGDGNGRR